MLTLHNFLQVARGVHIEHDDFQFVLTAKRKGGLVHHLELTADHLVEGNLVELHGRGILYVFLFGSPAGIKLPNHRR